MQLGKTKLDYNYGAKSINVSHYSKRSHIQVFLINF